jgi:hypothetical protein
MSLPEIGDGIGTGGVNAENERTGRCQRDARNFQRGARNRAEHLKSS